MRWIALTATCILTLLPATPAAAQMSFGPQLSFGTDSDFGLGARLLFPLRPTQALGIDGVIDGNYFFADGVDSWLDANVNIRLPVPLAEQFETRIGAGLNVASVSVDDDASIGTETKTKVGLNVLGNIHFPRRTLMPFGELRVILGGHDQVVLTGGFTIGSGN